MSEAREEQASGSASPAAQLPSKDETPITPAIKTEAEGTPESPPLLRRSTRQAAKFAKTPVYPQQAEEHDESDSDYDEHDPNTKATSPSRRPANRKQYLNGRRQRWTQPTPQTQQPDHSFLFERDVLRRGWPAQETPGQGAGPTPVVRKGKLRLFERKTRRFGSS